MKWDFILTSWEEQHFTKKHNKTLTFPDIQYMQTNLIPTHLLLNQSKPQTQQTQLKLISLVFVCFNSESPLSQPDESYKCLKKRTTLSDGLD